MITLFTTFLQAFTTWLVTAAGAIRALGDLSIYVLLSFAGVLFPSVPWSTVQSYIDKLNYVFPVSECVVMAEALFVLWAHVWLYRAVKAWFPSVSGG